MLPDPVCPLPVPADAAAEDLPELVPPELIPPELAPDPADDELDDPPEAVAPLPEPAVPVASVTILVTADSREERAFETLFWEASSESRESRHFWAFAGAAFEDAEVVGEADDGEDEGDAGDEEGDAVACEGVADAPAALPVA